MLITLFFVALWCGSVWVMPGTENDVLTQPGCYSCCDYNQNFTADPGECRFWPGKTMNQCLRGE